MSDKKTHILVIRLSAMGDVAMAVPVLRALTTQHKNLKLTVLTRKFFEPFFRSLPNVTVYEADIKKNHKGILGLFKLSKELREIQIHKIADLHNVLRSNLLKFFLFDKSFIQIQKGRNEKKQLVSGTVFKQLKTTHERYADVFRKLGYSINLNNPTFEPKAQLSDSLKTLICFNADKKHIGIAPFAAHQGKMYDLQQMEEVIQTLSKTNKVVLFGGGKKEIEILNTIENKYKNVTSVAGKINLNEELDIISNLDAMLSMDSGNSHIAAMFGLKVITIWNVTHPYAGFYPFHQPKEHALLADRKLYPKIPTSIYGNKYPEGYEMAASKTITPNNIIKKTEQIIVNKTT